jgi:hypothetical protein
MKTQSGSDFQVKISDKLKGSVKQKMKDEFYKLTTALAEQMEERMTRQKKLTGHISGKIADSLDYKKMDELKLFSEEFLRNNMNIETEIPKIRSEKKRIRETLKKEQQAVTTRLNVDFKKAVQLQTELFRTMPSQEEIPGLRINKNAMSGDQLKKYLKLHNTKGGHFDTPSGGGNGNDFDIAIYQAPFDGSGYRWSFSYSGSNFNIDEHSNRVYDANLGITANQVAVSLGVNAVDDQTYFDCENVSLVLINHLMKTNGHVRVVGFIQCINDSDEVKILDHSQVFTWLGNVGVGYSETKDAHSLYLDVDGENIGKNAFYNSDVIPYDTDDHDYTNLDDNLPAEVRALGIDIPVNFNQNEVIPLWIGTGTESNSRAVGQEIRVNTAQSWKLQEVWVITEN